MEYENCESGSNYTNQVENCENTELEIDGLSQNKELTRKERKRLEYEERNRKKKEKQIKKIKKIITKCNIKSLDGLKNNALINNNDIFQICENSDQLTSITKTEHTKQKLNNGIDEYAESLNKEQNDNNKNNSKPKDQNNINNLCMNNHLQSLGILSKKQIMKTLKNKLKKNKESEKKMLFKKIEQFNLNNKGHNTMKHNNVNNKSEKNHENLDKLLKVYEQMNIDLPKNLKIAKNKLETRKKRLLKCINKKELESIFEQEENNPQKKSKVIKQFNHEEQNYQSEENKSNDLTSENSDGNLEDNHTETSKDDSVTSSINLYNEEENILYQNGNDQNEMQSIEIKEYERIDEGDGNVNKKDKIHERKILYERVNINRDENIEKLRSSLPVVGYEQEIIEAILNHDVVFISGDTGCGKSTQVPQFAYEYGFSTNNYLIGITEPRKIAVKSISNRLNEELNIKDVAGYQVRFEKSHFLKNSKIKVMTEGILLKEIMSDFVLSKYSIIILDEAHERSINMDLILGFLSIICKIRKEKYFAYKSDIIPLKVIIMSATITDNNLFENKIFTDYTSINIPTDKVPVVDHFLSYTPKDYVEEAKKKIIQIHKKLPPGSILVFLTSQEEIYQLYNALNNLKMTKEIIENTTFSENNQKHIESDQDENSQIFDLPEEKNTENERISFFVKDQDENKEKTIIFDASDDEDSDSEEDEVNSKVGDNGIDTENSFKNNFESKEISQNEEISFNSSEKIPNGNDTNAYVYTEKEISSEHNEMEALEKEVRSFNENDLQNHFDNDQKTDGKIENDQNNELSSDTDQSDQNNNDKKNMKSSYKENNNENSKKESTIWKGSDGSGKLTVYKLYSNLPIKKQMQLFNNPKDNERVCILSTNIAETSLTLPNIRYVIDSGKEKKKIYSTVNDYSYYIIDNISKSSALQRKGRAGRVLHLLKNNKKNKKKIEMEKGHVYKLYSSNYYNYFFKNNTDVPILNYPLDSLILYLLSFKIENVEKFPFINKPDSSKFQEARKRLIYFNCIYFGYKDIEFLFKNLSDKIASKQGIQNHVNMFNPQNKKGITLVGNFILSSPISIRYAKILTDVCLKSLSIKNTSTIPLACLLVSCLYLESIFSYDYKLSLKYKNSEKKKKKKTNNNQTNESINTSNNILMNLILKKNNDQEDQSDGSDSYDNSSDEDNNSSYQNPNNDENSINMIEEYKSNFSNDIDFYLNLCISFYFSKERDQYCYNMKLDKKKMDELLKLSNHLMKIINFKLNHNITFDMLEKNISPVSKKIIYYAIFQGFIDHLAIRSDLIHNEHTRNLQIQNYNNKKAYFTQNMNTPIYINSTSALYKNRPYPQYILYNYIMKNRNSYLMFDCLNISDSDLGKITNVCIYINGYEKIPPPTYDIEKDKIIVCARPIYLPASHYLSIITKELNENDIAFYNYIALFTLDGSMFPKMLKFQKFYSHTASNIINCSTQNIKKFISELKNNKINNRASLIFKWEKENSFLKQEFMSLIANKITKYDEKLINNSWPPID
ncbi:ATP-dependent RNA helicase DHR1, putative [Plasmodium vinckei]|uniref:RNA helicase n=1 Tax=Plasmodium vinckei TaxID=5860 RepID=A0A6V7TGI9_PLAVN|nr:ATP-dependent RNA helicase DHR1, putative [Plasmodium vinckei]